MKKVMVANGAQFEVGDYEAQLAGNLEGHEDVQLAYIRGEDIRRRLPKEYFVRKPMNFIAKLGLALGIIVAGAVGIYLTNSVPLIALCVLVNGLIFAHLIELQHECMHGHVFKSMPLNRFLGTVCGIFMASSTSHYRYDHLRHHAWLGTPRNMEHFNYRFANLDSVFGFTKAFFDLSRYKRTFKILWAAFQGKSVPGVEKRDASRQIQQEYFLYLALVVAAIGVSLYSSDIGRVIVLAWLIPSLVIAEGVHFMIEMPEHFGLNTMTDANVLSNTRTIKTSKLVHWFVNGNDLHTAHHYHQGVPMCNVEKLHELIKGRIDVVEESYFSLYKKIISGEIKQDMNVACMDR